MLITSLWITDLLIILVGISFVLYKYFSRKYNFWKKRGISYVKPVPFFGNAYEVFTFKKTIGEWLKNLYDSVDEKFFGIFIFHKPYLILKSPELIKQILVKDFGYFTDRNILAPKHNEITSNVLFVQKSPDWKKIRPKITPVFTSGKLKGMFPIINDVGLEMNKYIRRNLGQQEAKEICSKYSTDVIAKCAFGINPHCFEQIDADFRKIGKSFFDFGWRNALSQTAYLFMQQWAALLHLEFFESWALTYLSTVFWQTIRQREETNIKGNDLIDLIVEMRRNEKLCNELNFKGDKVVTPAVQFFAAGFETTSSTIAFTLYELCVHPQMQDKLRSEIINTIKEYNGITYDSIQSMKYLEMCIMETLRKYPVLPFLDRLCNEDYKIPGTDFVIEKGTPVYIPMLGLHYDEKYFPEPDKYDPERFCDKNSNNVDGFNYIPFGEGPRICIGERFGMLGAKLGIVYILSEFVLERTPDTPVPIQFEPKSFVLQSKTGLPMKFKEFRSTPA